MASKAREELQRRLDDVDELIKAHGQLTGAQRGRPRDRKGAAVTRAGVVLLAAATEAYVEDLFEESAELIFRNMAGADLEKLFKNTSRRMNNADVHKIEMLYFNLGLAWVLGDIRWKKFSNCSFRKGLNNLVQARNKVAHGKNPNIRLNMLKRWKNMIEMFSPKLEQKIKSHIRQLTGQYPNW